MIQSLNQKGMTVIYSTHYMEEVETLCDTAAIMDHGKVMDHGPLQQLLENHGQYAIYIEGINKEALPTDAGIQHIHPEGSGWLLATHDTQALMKMLLAEAAKNNWPIKQLNIRRPSLETVFFSLTGTTLRDQ